MLASLEYPYDDVNLKQTDEDRQRRTICIQVTAKGVPKVLVQTVFSLERGDLNPRMCNRSDLIEQVMSPNDRKGMQ